MIRRDFLKLSSVATVGLTLPVSLASAKTKAQSPCVIVDPRFNAALIFADAARAAHADVLLSHGDLASLWHGTMRGEAAEGMRGLTSYADMIVAGSIAADARRSLRFRMSHHVAHDEPGHRLSIGSPIQIKILEAAEERWPLALWSMMAIGSSAYLDSQRRGLEAGARTGTLWSWAIA